MRLTVEEAQVTMESLKQQRNTALDEVAVLRARLAICAETLGAAQRRLAELESDIRDLKCCKQ